VGQNSGENDSRRECPHGEVHLHTLEIRVYRIRMFRNRKVLPKEPRFLSYLLARGLPITKVGQSIFSKFASYMRDHVLKCWGKEKVSTSLAPLSVSLSFSLSLSLSLSLSFTHTHTHTHTHAGCFFRALCMLGKHPWLTSSALGFII
jgi:hypothetical protein